MVILRWSESFLVASATLGWALAPLWIWQFLHLRVHVAKLLALCNAWYADPSPNKLWGFGECYDWRASKIQEAFRKWLLGNLISLSVSTMFHLFLTNWDESQTRNIIHPGFKRVESLACLSAESPILFSRYSSLSSAETEGQLIAEHSVDQCAKRCTINKLAREQLIID